MECACILYGEKNVHPVPTLRGRQELPLGILRLFENIKHGNRTKQRPRIFRKLKFEPFVTVINNDPFSHTVV